MSKDKKPDNVVFNLKSDKYDASLRPYGTNLSAPKIKVTDTVAWKNRSINRVNHKVKTKFLELKLAYDKMIQEFEYNQLIFDSKFSFEPIIGETYYLYKRDNSETFLSLIEPEHCKFNYLGSFYLNAEQIWQKI
ncbi:DUF2452 domain-containing protein [Cellulophaga baltica]|uniref:DUF2452 domain-containing protein n=1 Tax=Cellulophaga TaxID=104264 RepID=UPI001C07A4BD|nr:MULTISPECIES: DUF2452 domain-containing protein [Cellulophaga]MBU2996918.1 DUF2452 domain-containing protein [Cellulophaga baltica]MDO6768316.1 DUF2452 domain-containing protein [Cellulophaga sp. 1_MG-2023]